MPVIEVTGLHKRYRDKVAVDDVTFTVERGEIFGILGPNGAGKTTTVECIAGLRRPDRGSIRVLGHDPRSGAAGLRARVGVQLQEGQLPDKLKVREALDLYASFYRGPVDWRQLLERLGLADQRDTPYRKLSGGQKQRLSIALALVGNPEVAILDELTTGLDPAARRDTWAVIEEVRARGVTILLVTHFMAEAERLCDRLALIESGRVAALDTPAGLVARASAEQRIRFRWTGEFDERLLAGVAEVSGITRAGSQITVTGTGNLLFAVVAVLAREQIVPAELRMEQSTLDDAFLALTGNPLEKES